MSLITPRTQVEISLSLAWTQCIARFTLLTPREVWLSSILITALNSIHSNLLETSMKWPFSLNSMRPSSITASSFRTITGQSKRTMTSLLLKMNSALPLSSEEQTLWPPNGAPAFSAKERVQLSLRKYLRCTSPNATVFSLQAHRPIKSAFMMKAAALAAVRRKSSSGQWKVCTLRVLLLV